MWLIFNRHCFFSAECIRDITFQIWRGCGYWWCRLTSNRFCYLPFLGLIFSGNFLPLVLLFHSSNVFLPNAFLPAGLFAHLFCANDFAGIYSSCLSWCFNYWRWFRWYSLRRCRSLRYYWFWLCRYRCLFACYYRFRCCFSCPCFSIDIIPIHISQ